MEGTRTRSASDPCSSPAFTQASMGDLETTNGRAKGARRCARSSSKIHNKLTINTSIEMAQLFRARSSSILATSVLKKWCGVRQSHQNARSFAVHYHRAQLQYKMLLAWRLQLRAKLRTVKQAKSAQKHLLLRRYFRTWAAKVEEQRRTRKLKAFELRSAKTYFLRKSAVFDQDPIVVLSFVCRMARACAATTWD